MGPILASTFSVSPPNAQRLLYASPIVAVIIALPLHEIHQQIRTTKPQYNTHFATAAVIFMLIVSYSEIRFFNQAMQEGRYSDVKSLVARKIGETIRQQETELEVYFLGQPVMGYNTLPCLPYIASNASGHDVSWPIDWEQLPSRIEEPTAFVILEHNAEALTEIEQRYPQGTTIVERDDTGKPLYYFRTLEP
jgi:hypothetical protein